MNHIFICYSQVDQAITRQLASLLDEVFKDCVWYDQRLTGGQEWWNEILKRIGESHSFVYLLSNEALQSEWCQKEYSEAKRLNKSVVPVVVRAKTEIPEELSTLQVVDMSNGLTVENLNKLYAALVRIGDQRVSAVEPQLVQAHRDADRNLLGRLWPLINSPYIERFDYEVQLRWIDYPSYRAHISQYKVLRSRPENRFVSERLEKAFAQFDSTLLDFVVILSLAYTTTRKADREFLAYERLELPDLLRAREAGHEFLDDQPKFWYEKYEAVVDKLLEFRREHAKLVASIKINMPEFELNES